MINPSRRYIDFAHSMRCSYGQFSIPDGKSSGGSVRYLSSELTVQSPPRSTRGTRYTAHQQRQAGFHSPSSRRQSSHSSAHLVGLDSRQRHLDRMLGTKQNEPTSNQHQVCILGVTPRSLTGRRPPRPERVEQPIESVPHDSATSSSASTKPRYDQ